MEKLMKCIRLLSIFAWKFAKNMFYHGKVQENTKYLETEGLWWEKDQNAIENTEVNKSSNQRKCTKSDQRNWKQVKNFNKCRNKSTRNESYYCYQKKNTSTNS